jgi:hypothetical protein
MKRFLFALASLPAVATSGLARVLFSRRGLALWFLVGAALFCAGPWLRPPLSPDIRGIQLPLSMIPQEVTADHILPKPREFQLDSVGFICLAIVLAGAALVMINPRRLALVAGALLAVSIAGNATAMFNHPKLIEMMDSEIIQRGQIATVLRMRSEQTLAGNSTPRTAPLVLPPHDNSPPTMEYPPGHLLRGWQYLVFGVWLSLSSFLVVLLACSGSWQRRLGQTALWMLGGLLLTVVACGARFNAEWHWVSAEKLELQGRLDAARAELDEAIDLYSEFELLERTWLLAGKIDYRRGKSTPQALYYRVAQLALHDDRGESVGLLSELLNSSAGRATAVRDLAGLVHADLARKSTSKGLLIAAYDDYKLAAKYAPLRVDAPAGMGLSLSESDRSRPELAEAFIDPLVERLGDRVLIADLLERLGHANFEAGRVVRAREYYERSMAVFSQPKYVNAPAQEGLLGM